MTKKEEIEKLEKRLAELKSQPELQLKKWYKDSDGIYFLDKIINEKAYWYGFTFDRWKKLDWYHIEHFINDCQEATQEEVEAALIKEAEKRGFKEGVTVNCGNIYNSESFDSKLEGGKWMFDIKNNHLEKYSNDGYRSIFKNGKWAEIIEEPKVAINGYEMKQDGDIISFGCAELDSCGVQDLLEGVEWFSGKNRKTNRKIKSITLDSGVEITVQQLKQIVDNIK